MTMADTSRVQLYAAQETTYGVVPTTPLDTLRFTGESLKFNISSVQSKEIRQDRQITDNILVGAEANGNFNWEFSFGAHDMLLEGALMGSFTTPINYTSTSVGVDSSDQSLNFSGTAPVLVTGQWIKVSGFATADNNGVFKVVSRTSSKVILNTTSLVTEVSGASVVIKASMLRNGVSKNSYSLEKKFSDVGQYITYVGMVVSNLNLNIQANEIVTGEFQFLGKSATISSSSAGTGSPNPPPTNSVMNAVSNVASILEDGVPMTGTYAKSLQISLNNNLRGKPGIGYFGNIDVGLGDCVVTGKLSVYFVDDVMYRKFIDNESTSFSTVFEDDVGNTYVITLHKIEFTDSNPAAGGSNQDVMLDLSYQALMDPVTGCTIQIDKMAS